MTFQARATVFRPEALSYAPAMEPWLVTHLGYTGSLTVVKDAAVSGIGPETVA
jgi:hypothetical protein